MSGIADKVKHVLHLDKDKSATTTTGHTTTSGTAEGVHGPHSSRAANAADPRIDSDRDGSSNLGANTTHTGTHSSGLTGTGHNTTHTSGLTGNNHSSGLTGTGHNTTHTSGLTGNNHSSGLTGTGHNTTHTSGLTGNNHSSGLTGNHTTSTNAGPHDSNLLNKADPRVDSDRSNQFGNSHSTTTHGTGLTGSSNNHTVGSTGTHGGISNSSNAGPHNSNLLNKADPTVDSDLSGRGNQHGAIHGGTLGSGTHATPGSGTAQNTAGPHNSDMLNKLDPRVDADLDGSKTIGGNKTHA